MHGFLIFWGQMTSFEVLWKCDLVTLSKICLRLHPSAYLSINLGIDWIVSRIPCGISKILFVQGWRMAELDRSLFSMIQYCKITVWSCIDWGRSNRKLKKKLCRRRSPAVFWQTFFITLNWKDLNRNKTNSFWLKRHQV